MAIRTGGSKKTSNKKINSKKVYQNKIEKKVKFDSINSKKEEHKLKGSNIKRFEALKGKTKDTVVNNLKSADGTIDSTPNAIYETKKQVDNLKDVKHTAGKVFRLRKKENRNIQGAKDIISNIKKPYIPTKEIQEDTRDTALSSIGEAKEKVRTVKDTYKFIRPNNKKEIAKSQKIRTQVNKRNEKIYSQVKEKGVIHSKKGDKLESTVKLDKNYRKKLEIELNKSQRVHKSLNNNSSGTGGSRFSSKQKIRTERVENSRAKLKNFKSKWKEKRKGSVKQKLYRSLKNSAKNIAKKIINFFKSPSRLIWFGGIALGIFIFMMIMNMFMTSVGASTTTVPNIKNPDEWITNMNNIDSAENTKIHSGEYFVLKNPDIKINWKNVIAVVMAKNENYMNDNGKDSDITSQDKTTVTGTYSEIINSVGNQYNVDPALISAIITQESSFNPNCLSPAGAMGLMQLMPENCKEYGVLNPYDPYQNIVGGTKQLADLLKLYNGNLTLVLAGYNAGIGNVEKYGGVPPFKETQDYIVKVTAYYEAYRNGKPLPDGTITGSITDVGNGDLATVYQLFNETISSTDEYGDTTVTLIKHDMEYVMNKLNFTKTQKEIARATMEADMFSEVFKNFDFKFKYNIPEGAENGQVVSTGLNAENLDGVVIQTNNKMRKDIIDTALKLVGKVKYFWGGKSPKGWNSAWGKDTLVTAPGSKTTGTIRPYGLDCSGFVGWVYDTANVSSMLQNGGTNYQYANSTAISPNEAKPGDLVFNNDISHVGIYVGRKDGKPIFIECSSSKGVTISSWSGFTQYRRPNLDFGGDN